MRNIISAIVITACLPIACTTASAAVHSDPLPDGYGGFLPLCDDECDSGCTRQHSLSSGIYTHSTCLMGGITAQCWDESAGGFWSKRTFGTSGWQREFNSSGARAVYNPIANAWEFDQETTAIHIDLDVPTTCRLRYTSLIYSSEGYGVLDAHVHHAQGIAGEMNVEMGVPGDIYERIFETPRTAIVQDRMQLWVEGAGQTPRVHGAQAWMTCPPEAY